MFVVNAKGRFPGVGPGDECGGNGGVELPGLGLAAVDGFRPAVAGVELPIRKQLDIKTLGQGRGVSIWSRGQRHDQGGRGVCYRGVGRVAHVRHASGGRRRRDR